MNKSKINIKQITLLPAITLIFTCFTSISHSKTYVGGGVGIINTKYRSSKDAYYTSDIYLDKYSKLSKTALTNLSFNGTKDELSMAIYSIAPKGNNDINFFIQFSELGGFGNICQKNNTIVDPNFYNTNDDCKNIFNNNTTSATLFNLHEGDEKVALELIEYDFGRSVSQFFLKNMSGNLTIQFANHDELKSFYSKVGKRLIQNFIGNESYNREELLEKLKSSDLLSVANSSALMLSLLPQDEMNQEFVIFQETINSVLLELNIKYRENNNYNLSADEIKELVQLKESASSTNVQIFFVSGIGFNIHNTYLGIEFGFDLGDISTGKNTNKEITISSKYLISIVGKIGHSFTKNSLNYINFGFGLREYTTSYNGSKLNFNASNTVNHLIFGTGFEIYINNNLGIFTELNYMTSMSKLYTGSPDGIGLDVSTTSLKIGVKYYLDGNQYLGKDNRNFEDRIKNIK